MTAPVVLLRADATAQSGIGHFVRCVALAEAAAAAGAPAAHLSGEVTAPLALRMAEASRLSIHAPVADSEQFVGLARRIGADVVHVDSYTSYADVRALGRSHGLVTSTATDERFGRRNADVIVDGAPRALTRFDPLYADADLCLGPSQLALRADDAPRPREREIGAPASVLILMGGTDATGIADRLSEDVAAQPGVGRVGVVGRTGSRRVGTVRIDAVDRQPSMARLVGEWDIVVSAAGTSVWELARLRKPMALVGVVENQRDHYQTLLESGMAIGLGFLPDDVDLRVDALAELIADPKAARVFADAGAEMVDGKGAERIVRTWSDVCGDRAQGDLSVRSAELRDAGRLYAWRNDASTRSASRSPEPVEWSDHLAWLAASLASTERALMVGIFEGEAVGTVRFDRTSDADQEISVTVAPAARGRGLAAPLVAAATQALPARRRRAARITAVLRSTNTGSRQLFDSLGYVVAGDDGQWETWQLDLSRLRADPS